MAAAGALKSGHLAVAAGLAAAGFLVWCGMKQTGPFVPVAVTEDPTGDSPIPPMSFMGPEQHLGPLVVSAHRYPHMVGPEITNLIAYGFKVLRMPHGKDANWFLNPPSENLDPL